ncbi:unnamed protein product, partial [Discosporangium mesarthrocarpum]
QVDAHKAQVVEHAREADVREQRLREEMVDLSRSANAARAEEMEAVVRGREEAIRDRDVAQDALARMAIRNTELQ